MVIFHISKQNMESLVSSFYRIDFFRLHLLLILVLLRFSQKDISILYQLVTVLFKNFSTSIYSLQQNNQKADLWRVKTFHLDQIFKCNLNPENYWKKTLVNLNNLGEKEGLQAKAITLNDGVNINQYSILHKTFA